MKRNASATWKGTVLDGQGHLSTDSRTLAEAPFSFPTRFGDKPGSNPEELMAAAHAGCFSMALAFLLGNAGTPPESIRTAAEISFEGDKSGWTVTGIHLSVVARVPGIDDAAFQTIAEQARGGCLVTRLVRVDVTLLARLEESPAARPASVIEEKECPHD